MGHLRQAGHPLTGIVVCQAGELVSLYLFLSLSLSLTHTSASSFTSPCARYVYVPSLCANESAADLTRKKIHTHTHTRPHAAFSRGEEEGREEEREKKRCPRLPSHPSIQHFSSFRLVPFIRQFFPFCAVPYAAALSLPPLFSCPPFLCAPSFFSPIASLPFFPIHPLFLLASFQFPSAWTRGLPLRSLLRECGELK